MATQMFLRGNGFSMDPPTTHRGTNSAKLDGVASGWFPLSLVAAVRGSSLMETSTATVTGATSGVEITSPGGGTAMEFYSEPLAANVTISGTVTCNIWACENNMSANVAINVVVDKVAATDQTITQVLKTARVTELAVSADGSVKAVNNFTATPSSTAFNRGDRIRIRVFGDDVGTMAGTFLFVTSWNGTTAAADGDTYVTFTENLTFESAPAGSTLYLTATASAVNPGAATEKEMWTSRGSGSTSVATSTQNGWLAPFQIGSPVLEWYTKALDAFTLAGMAELSVRAMTSDLASRASLRGELAVCDTDGTNAVVWGTTCKASTSTFGSGLLSTTEEACKLWIAGASTAVTAGKRLRCRIYLDDYAEAAMISSYTVTITYSGTTGAAAGDTYLVLPQTVTEQGTASTNPRPVQRVHGQTLRRASVR